MESRFYRCRLTMKRTQWGKGTDVLFKRGVVYKALDHDSECILFRAEDGDFIIIDKYKEAKYFERVNIMPDFKRKVANGR